MSEPTHDLTVDELTDGMRKRLGESAGLNATFKFIFNDGRVIFIDGRSIPNSVNNDDKPADVTLKLSVETLNKIRRKELNPMMAAMTGAVKIEGNVMMAMKLDQVLG